MFQSVLVANRGEIACRILGTARRMGLHTIAIYSEVDSSALHVAMADEAFEIGPPPAVDSYLQAHKIIELANMTGAESIHPGYGFLSENAEFAELCAGKNIKFIGPPVQAMRKMAYKHVSKSIMADAGIPVIPGFMIDREVDENLLCRIREIGFPVMVKAVAGGGGKGLRQVDSAGGLEEALDGAVREAESSFGDGRVMIEKYIPNPRHIEVQVFGDAKGKVVHLFERDCSLQRRHQKVIEEAPAPEISEKFREKICAAGVLAAKTVGYQGAGTVEFLVEGLSETSDPEIYFMEMNTRLQVEHTVTEMITDLDLVEWQFRVAAGEALPETFGSRSIRGHAVEARLYAEDPANGFLPSTGKLLALNIPADKNVRIDTGVETGSDITPYYDPMIAKIIAHGQSRDEALGTLKNVLEYTSVAGLKTNAGFLLKLILDPDVGAARLSTRLIGNRLKTLATWEPDLRAIAVGVSNLLTSIDKRSPEFRETELELDREISQSNDCSDPWHKTDGFQLGGERYLKKSFIVDGETIEAGLLWTNHGLQIKFDDRLHFPHRIMKNTRDIVVYPSTWGCFVTCGPHQIAVECPDLGLSGVGDNRGGGLVLAPMHGKIVQLLVEQGQNVMQGQPLVVLEAMKMEHIIRAPHEGVLISLSVLLGQQVSTGDFILEVCSEELD